MKQFAPIVLVIVGGCGLAAAALTLVIFPNVGERGQTTCRIAPEQFEAARREQFGSTAEQSTGRARNPVDPQSASIYAVTDDGAGEQVFDVAAIENPAVTLANYAVVGEVRNSDVEGSAYLLTWNYFPRGGPYFSKGMSASGPSRFISGSSSWRYFALPFFCGGEDPTATARPVKVELKLALPGPGVVAIRNVRLVQFADGQDALASPDQWWTDSQANRLGVIAGCAIGGLGALLGVLVGIGRARRFAILLAFILVAFGVASLICGLVALMSGQPYGVHYPLLLGGILLATVIGAQIRTLRRRYEQVELRRMRAMDVS